MLEAFFGANTVKKVLLSNDRGDDARKRIEAHPHNNYEMGSPIFSHN